MAGPLAPAEEGIVYADVDLNDAVSHYFLHETTGHYWSKQFRVFFDAREMKPLNYGSAPDTRPSETEEEMQCQEILKENREV